MLNEHIKPKSPFFLDTLNMEHSRKMAIPRQINKIESFSDSNLLFSIIFKGFYIRPFSSFIKVVLFVGPYVFSSCSCSEPNAPRCLLRMSSYKMV